jgi:lipid-binding SYLF domain-containing protein
LLAAGTVYAAATKEQKRLEHCGVVLQEVLNIPDNLPQQVLAKAECVIVFPSVLKLAFGMGKDYGRGAMVCRTGKEFNGRWGAPAMYALEGDSLGMQIGGESTDLILRVMNQKGAASILSSKIKLGGDASAAAGPKGRDASANIDLVMRAEILSYFAFPRTICRHFPRRFHPASRQQSQRANLPPQNHSKSNPAAQHSCHSRIWPPFRSRIANECTAE